MYLTNTIQVVVDVLSGLERYNFSSVGAEAVIHHRLRIKLTTWYGILRGDRCLKPTRYQVYGNIWQILGQDKLLSQVQKWAAANTIIRHKLTSKFDDTACNP